jgi:hypothetical protein
MMRENKEKTRILEKDNEEQKSQIEKLEAMCKYLGNDKSELND